MSTQANAMDQTLDILYCYRNRDLARVKQSLDSLTLQTHRKFHVMFIDYGSDEAIAHEVKALCAQYSFCRYEYINTSGKFWSRAQALNYGFHLSVADFVFTADIDMVFKDTFVDYLRSQFNTNTTSFFSVGYLSQRTTEQLDVHKLEHVKYTRSESFALGMALLSKEVINAVNGYDAFYSLWGVEDNDLKYRIEQAGFSTTFITESVFMFHQYHPASNNNTTVIPTGWLQFMKDYHEANKAVKTSRSGKAEIQFPVERPAISVFNSPDTSFELMNNRTLFIRHTLITAVLNTLPNAYKAYRFEINETKQSFLSRFILFCNSVFTSLHIPLELRSVYSAQYTSKISVRDEVYFVLQSLEQHIKDYYLFLSDTELKLVIVKK